jgi:ketosteroid isomerase-like protein
VLNGTFTSSESPVARDRLRDLTVMGADGLAHPDTGTWTPGTKESAWHVRVAKAGTHVMGASTYPRTIRLTGAQFNEYLREDGLPDVLAARRASGTLGKGAHERYSKHVKALVRVEDGAAGAAGVAGDTAYAHVMGYPAELVPLDDPYRVRAGAAVRVRALVDGVPVSNQLVLAGGRTAAGAVIRERGVRTDEKGVARVPLRSAGVWYVKFIRMRPVPAAARDSVDYESKWATLTFAVR